MPTIPPALHELLESQEQLVTTAQARRVGVHGGPLARLVDRGALEPIASRLYGRPDVPPTWRRSILGALLRAGPGAAASHRSCARLLQIPTYEAALAEISVPSKRGFSHPGVVVHESRDLDRVPLLEIDGIRCTPPLRLAVDIGAVLGPRAHATVLRELRRSHGATWRQLAAVLRLHSRRGRDGCGPLRAHLERYFGMRGIPESTLEQDLFDLLLEAGLPRPASQHPVHTPWGTTYRLDAAYVRERLDVEADGPRHRTPEGRAHDARRDRYLRSIGWEVVRFDDDEIVHSPQAVAGRVRRALAAGS